MEIETASHCQSETNLVDQAQAGARIGCACFVERAEQVLEGLVEGLLRRVQQLHPALAP